MKHKTMERDETNYFAFFDALSEERKQEDNKETPELEKRKRGRPRKENVK